MITQYWYQYTHNAIKNNEPLVQFKTCICIQFYARRILTKKVYTSLLFPIPNPPFFWWIVIIALSPIWINNKTKNKKILQQQKNNNCSLMDLFTSRHNTERTGLSPIANSFPFSLPLFKLQHGEFNTFFNLYPISNHNR